MVVIAQLSQVKSSQVRLKLEIALTSPSVDWLVVTLLYFF